MAGEIDAIAVVESDLSSYKPPDSIEMLKELSIQKQNGEENHNDVSCLPVVNVPTDISKKSEVENSIQPWSSQPCMESSPVDDSSTPELSESIGMLNEIYITDVTVSSCETQDCKENHNHVICVPVVSDPIDTLKKIKVENGIKPCLETLKSSPVDDSSTHKPQGSVGMLKELSITDLTATSCEMLEESDPTDSSKNSEVENRIQPCSLQPCLETLESSPDLSTHKPQGSIGMPKELSITDFTVTEQNVERNDNDVNCLPVVSDPTCSLKKSEVENRIQPCSLQYCLETQESSPVENLSTCKLQGSIGMLKELSITDFAVTCCEVQNVEENHNDLLGNYSQENERKDDKSVSSPFEEGASGVVEEESDVTTEIKNETLHQKLCIGGDAYDLKEDSSGIPLHSLESFLPVNVTEDRSLGKPDASHPFEKAAFRGASTWSAAESYELKDIEGKDLAGTSSPTRLPKNGPSFSCRSSRVHRSSHETQRKRASRRSKNKGKVQDLHIFMAERKRRTCFSKPARSSYWGLLGNIDKIFEHANRLGLNEIHNSKPTQRNLFKESRKQSKSRASGSSQGSGEKKNTSTSCIRLKVKVGNEVFRSIIVSDAFGSSVFGGLSDFETKSRAGTSFEVPSFVNGNEDKMRAVGIDKQLQCFDSKLGEAKLQSDTSVMDLHLADKDLEGTGVSQKRYTDPGTSPDSEVINLVPDSQANTRSPENLPLPSNFAPAVISISKRGKTKDIVSDVSDCFPGDISSQLTCANKAKDKKKQGSKKSKDNGNFSCEILRSSMDANALSNSLSRKDSSQELSHLSSKNDILIGEANKLCAGLDSDHKLLESQFPNHLLPSKKSKVCRLPKNSRGASKGRSKVSDKAGNNRENARKQKVKEHKSINQKKVKEKKDFGDNNCKTEEGDMKTGSILDGIDKIISDSNTALLEVPNVDLASSNIAEQHISVDNAWVSCDDCHKWRRIPVALVDSIGQTNCQWICKDNTDKAFADCSIPQEKSNAEINAELGISDADVDTHDAPSKSKSLECKRPGFVSNEHEFTLLSSNQFLHRSRKTQTIDEIMVCHCKLPLDGRLGCGDECLNQMLNIECVQGTCPCGDLCSNQQFQNRNYVKMKWDRCGKKGFGLRLEENISEGHFLIEYVGEVLDMHTYEARQREYAFNSHKHFYFMTLNGSEVIDACAKGNLGRFINHSCDPNCRTEKWVVNGEICIGLFALRDIKKGEEVTFDYNYVRVFGAAAKQCYCGSSNCRGYIGGDPTSTEVIDQVDSDEEFLEPVLLEDWKTGSTFKNRKSRGSSLNDEPRVTEFISEDKNKIDHPKVPEVKLEVASEIQDAVDQSNSDVSQLNPSFESDDSKASVPPFQAVEISATSNDIISKSVAAANHEISMEENQRCEASPSDGIIAKLKSKSSIVEEKRVFVKSRFLVKTSRESSSKKRKVASNHLNANKLPTLANKSQMLSIKPKKFMHGTSNGRLETVEEKLNELLDVDGGISKKKDAAKGYLKFLVHTATSGASGNGEAIQSNRDLSMILDALLKTKSRIVLVDVINKNGLRMLHNMIKQYRKDFKKTPILRKLLKALEYLAVREILAQEHINGVPPCPGMESFRESILSLTEHDDKQVHQIARNFRDRWIPRHSRRHGNMDRDEGRMDFRRNSTTNRIHNHSHDVAASPAHAIVTQPKPETTSVDATVSDGCSGSCGTKRRKRKSRWDQPSPTKPSQPNAGKYMLDHVEEGTKESCPYCACKYSGQDETSSADSTRQNILSDVPPGFSSITNLPEQNDGLKFPEGMVVGYQQKFDSRSSVSYGIPMPIMQKFEAPQDGTKERWGIAPGMPFHPFPPLPPFPPRTEDSRSSPPANSTAVNETTENEHFRHDNNPSTTGYNQLDTESPVEGEQHSFKRARAPQDLGKMFFRQQ